MLVGVALPDPLEREWLMAALETLIEARGEAPVLSAPLLFADARSFPDPWSPDADGVAALARRLLGHAGLAHLGVSIETFEEERAIDTVGLDGKAASWSHAGAAAWFAGIRGATCLFGIEVGKLGDALGLVAAMAHEVAHAYRAAHRLVHRDHDVEERLTDVTTVYLGFGVLTTAASERFTTRSRDDLGSSYQHQRQGYLAPHELGFLLGAQLRLRGYDPGTIKAIARCLPANQAAAVHAATRALDRAQVAEQLGFTGPPAAQPPPAHLPRAWWKRLLGGPAPGRAR